MLNSSAWGANVPLHIVWIYATVPCWWRAARGNAWRSWRARTRPRRSRASTTFSGRGKTSFFFVLVFGKINFLSSLLLLLICCVSFTILTFYFHYSCLSTVKMMVFKLPATFWIRLTFLRLKLERHQVKCQSNHNFPCWPSKLGWDGVYSFFPQLLGFQLEQRWRRRYEWSYVYAIAKFV